MRLMAIATLVVVVFVVASAEAQTPPSNPTANSFSRSEFRLDLFRFAARTSGLSLRPAGFSLMPARSASVNASAMTPLATGPNLQVLGGGTPGRLTKWTGISRGAGNRGGSGILAAPGVGLDGATDGLAGDFRGDVEISGNLSKGGGSFKIDHPLDPENKYLYHSFVESPDMMNIYNGNAVTGADGDAVVELPAYFEALNRDFRYQLTVIGTFAQAIVTEEIKDNRFTIKTSAANVKVSWQVTGIRQDPYANKNRIKVEEDKPERERGFYLHSEAFNQPEERSVYWLVSPERIERLKQRHPKH